MTDKVMNILGIDYKFDPDKDQVLKRGLIDPYMTAEHDNEWVVIEEYIFWSKRLQAPIVVPRWFLTDLASIPKFLRMFISVNERHRIASLPHDYGYRMIINKKTPTNRHMWDLVFRDFCIQQGVSRTKAYIMYMGVRLGGWLTTSKEESDIFIPETHREYIREWYDDFLPLDVKDGEYLEV